MLELLLEQFAGPWPRACQIMSVLFQHEAWTMYANMLFLLRSLFQQSAHSSNLFQSSVFFQPEFREVLQQFLKPLFLVWKLSARGACSRGVPNLGIGTCLSLDEHLFLKFVSSFFLWHRCHILYQCAPQHKTKMRHEIDLLGNCSTCVSLELSRWKLHVGPPGNHAKFK